MRPMKQVKDCVLTVKAGSSIIKFGLFEANPILRRILAGTMERIGQSDAVFVVRGLSKGDNLTRSVTTNRVRRQILQTVGTELITPYLEQIIITTGDYHANSDQYRP